MKLWKGGIRDFEECKLCYWLFDRGTGMRINLLDCFEDTVRNKAEIIAIIHKEEQISFLELRQRAIKLAMVILDISKLAVNVPVAVFLPKEINTVAADLGIMYSSNPFMNLDVKMPRERIEKILLRIQPCAIITNAKYAERLKGVIYPLILIENAENSNYAIDISILKQRRDMLIDTDPLCIINTSGSTGTPKGVVLNHRSFLDFLDWSIERFDFNGSEIMGSLSPVVFDIFNFELCMMMVRGVKLVLIDAFLASFPIRLLEALNTHMVNFIFWVPSIMVNIANLELLDKITLPFLKTVWFAGEVFPTKQFLYWYDRLPETLFVNLYGPIEITLDCTYYVVECRPDENKPLPIGIPCRNTDIIILNNDNCRCKKGEEGELCVRGTSLAMGYYNNLQKTAEVFIQNPLNSVYPELIYRTGDIVLVDDRGLIQFRGRKDSLVKHMGYRIELGEIEHVIINDLKLAEYCCAVYQFEKKEIVLYYEKNIEITAAEFRKALSKVFPVYMVPVVYIRMDLLPRNENGKIDRLLLKNMINEVG